MRISDCSSDVCSSDLLYARARESKAPEPTVRRPASGAEHGPRTINQISAQRDAFAIIERDRGMRSEERRVGKECDSTCRCRWSPYHSKNKVIYHHIFNI